MHDQHDNLLLVACPETEPAVWPAG